MAAKMSAVAAPVEPQKDLRALILEAAEMQFRTRGYADTSLADIAATVDLTGPALYYYFASKSDLLFHSLREPMQRQIDLCRKATQGKTPLEQVHAFVYAVVRSLLDSPLMQAGHGHAFVDMTVLAQSLPDEQQAEILGLEHTSATDLRDIIQRGIRAKEVRPVDPTATAFALLGMATNITWFDVRGRLTPDEVATQYADLAVAAIR
jgi:AcrR family transcriptional regulator